MPLRDVRVRVTRGLIAPFAGGGLAGAALRGAIHSLGCDYGCSWLEWRGADAEMTQASGVAEREHPPSGQELHVGLGQRARGAVGLGSGCRLRCLLEIVSQLADASCADGPDRWFALRTGGAW